MKAYKTGFIGILATATSLLANLEISQKFNVEYPIIFWGGQIFLCALLIVLLLYTLNHWDNGFGYSRWTLFRSVCVCFLMYCMAYTDAKYSFVLIFVVGIVESYITRKRFGLVKK